MSTAKDEAGASTQRVSVARAVLAALGVGIVAGFAAWVLILASPVGRVTIDLRVESSAAGSSQMFFAADGEDFTEWRSATVPVKPGPTLVTFTISDRRETLGSLVRWDPLDTPADMVVKSATVGSNLVRAPLPLDALVPSVDMSSVMSRQGSVAFSTLSNDSQALVDVDLRSTYDENQRRVTLLALLVGMVTGLVTLLVALRRPSWGSWRAIGVAALTFLALLLLAWGLQLR